MSFEELYSAYYETIYRYSFRVMGSSESAKDIAQETFIRMYKCIDSGNDLANPRAWLYRVAGNLCKNKIKKTSDFQTNISPRLNHNGIKTDTESDYVQKEEIDRIRTAIRKLAPRDQLLLQLYQDGLSYKEMADVIRINKNSVGKTLSRAIGKVAALLKEEKLS